MRAPRAKYCTREGPSCAPCLLSSTTRFWILTLDPSSPRSPMISSRFIGIALVATATLSAGAPAQQQTGSSAATGAHRFPSDDEILRVIKQRVDEKRSAGIVVGIVEDG